MMKRNFTIKCLKSIFKVKIILVACLFYLYFIILSINYLEKEKIDAKEFDEKIGKIYKNSKSALSHIFYICYEYMIIKPVKFTYENIKHYLVDKPYSICKRKNKKTI